MTILYTNDLDTNTISLTEVQITSRVAADYITRRESTTIVAELVLRFNLYPLHTRRQLQDLQLLYKLVNGKLDCPDLLRQVNFYIPRGTRSKAVFGRVYRPTSYASNCSLARMQRTGGLVCDGFDFFQGSWLSFKWRCSRVLS
ncbi:hypothetical protein J6590_024260 [Homalodisca vitripennis]|nr:hypothetical protein J6590_024260 [Homalodisca vitripennis]